MKQTIVVMAFLLMLASLNAALLFEDNFTGTPGTLLTANGWTNHSGTSNLIPISATNLTYPGYQSSSGGSASLLATGEDVHANFTAQTAGSIYASCLVSVTSSQTAGDYIFHFGTDAWTTTFSGRLFVKKDSATTNFAFGINKGTAGAIVYTGFSYAVNTTYLVVLKYTIVPGTGNDEVKLFINPAFGAEPAADLTVSTSDTAADPSNIGGIALRQGNSSNAPVALVDGIRVGTAWEDVAGGAPTAPTTQAADIAFANVAQTQMDVSWTNGNGAKRIVIMNTSNSFTNPVDGTDPVADPIYSGSDEQIVYNDNGNSVTVGGLTAATTYWFRVYEYNGNGIGTLYQTATATGNPNSQITATGVVIPTVTTSPISAITLNSATSGGEVTADGGGTVTNRGVCWNTTGMPTLADDYTEDGTGTGVFVSSLTGLAENQQYYVRAYATNSAGDGFGNEVIFTTLKSEPSNHATGFTAANGASPDMQILVSWIDAMGPVVPDGYLVKGSAVDYSSVVDPVDGTPEANGSLVRNVTSGTQSYTFAGLSSVTTYYFKIFPYTNSGTGINYKVDGTVPTASHTTAAGPALTEVIVPQYIQGINGTNNQRVPWASRLTISNLAPNVTYRYYGMFVQASDSPTTNGAGVGWFANSNGTFGRSTQLDLSTLGRYGEFITDANGTYTGWFMGEPSANARFTPGNDLWFRIMLNDGNNGTSVATRLTTASSIRVINFGTEENVNQGTFLYDVSAAPAKDFVFVYDNVTGTGRPIAGNVIESDGLDLAGVSQILPVYKNSVDNVEGAWGVIIPNSVGAKGFTGIQRVEVRVFETGALYAANTDPDGVWGNVNTVNPLGGDTTPINLTGEATLPVELSSFTAVVTSDMFVNLNWVAESETDHAGYNIYRNGSGDLASAQRINNLIINEGNAAGTQISYSYSDYEAYSNMQYYYWLESVSLGGVSQYFGPLQITVGNLEEDPEAPEIMLSTKLLNAFPNPFNPNTNLRYTMKEAGNVTIEIFNTKGQLVRSFAGSHTSPGFYQMAWDGRDMNGNLVSSGVYMYRMHSGNYSASKRMILAK